MDDAALTGASDRDALYRKITWRIMPLLVLCYIANFVDRTNIGIAWLQMQGDVGFGPEIYGIGVGLFYVGFILFEIPSNVMLERIGARKTLLRIMVLWGLVSTATMFATTPWRFYSVRLLLGVAEAGFFPGCLLYLTYWFPSARRTRITSLFFLGLPLSGIIGSAASGWILHSFDNVLGLGGWQWMFLLEGFPSAILGVTAYLYLADRPQDASWLSPAEKQIVASDLASEQAVKSRRAHGLLQAARDPRVYILGAVGIGAYTLANAVSFWQPTIIRASGVQQILNIGYLGSLPPLVGIVAMLWVGHHSDRTLERRWHAACCYFAAAAAMIVISLFSTNPYLIIAMLALMTAAHYSQVTVFWSVPSVYLSERAAAGGIAMVTTMGAMAGALSPVLLGWIQQRTGELAAGLQISAAIVVAGAIVLLVGVPARVLRESRVGAVKATVSGATAASD